jgi:hypothetical protein
MFQDLVKQVSMKTESLAGRGAMCLISSHRGSVHRYDPGMPGLWHVVCGVYKPAESRTKGIVLSFFILLPIYRNR